MRISILAIGFFCFSAAADNSLYACARQLALLHYSNEQALGPIFFRDKIAFTSSALVPGGKQKYFIVLTENQILTAPINESAIQRMFFWLNGSSYFVGYMHGEILGNRYFEFSRGTVPDGKSHSDYKYIGLTPNPQFTQAVVGLMDNQLDQVLHVISEGGLEKSEGNKFDLTSCQGINRVAHADELHHKVDVFRIWMQAPSGSSRMPASSF